KLRRRRVPPAAAGRSAPPARRSRSQRDLTGSRSVPMGKRSLLAIGAAVIVVAIVAGVAVWYLTREEKKGPSAYPLDDTLRLNQVQVLATHNSYHIQQDVPIPASLTTQYTHAPLDQQLETQGVRGFEIDVVNAPDGGFPVVHTPVVDTTSNCTPLAQCLEV